MANEKNVAGRKPSLKAWATKFGHTFRTDYQNDSGIHILLFMAGDRGSDLIQVALREFAKSNGIPVDDPLFQEAVCLQAGTVIAKTKNSPCATEVMQAIGQSSVLKKLISSIEGKDVPDDKKAKNSPVQRDKPKNKTIPDPSAMTIAAHPIAVEPRFAPQQPVDRAVTPPPVVTALQPVIPRQTIGNHDSITTPSQQPTDLDMGMGDEIEMDSGSSQPDNNLKALKSRWLSGHDY